MTTSWSLLKKNDISLLGPQGPKSKDGTLSLKVAWCADDFLTGARQANGRVMGSYGGKASRAHHGPTGGCSPTELQHPP
jgi:hypothetical protein